jgi:hypothetical protein
MKKWIAIGGVKRLNIPAMALAHSSSRENRIDQTLPVSASKHLNPSQHEWLREQGLQDRVRVIQTRNYLPVKTAAYSTWLVLPDERAAKAFRIAFPRFDPDHRLEQIVEQKAAVMNQIKDRVNRGGYDLSKHPADQWRGIASEFLKLDKKLTDLDEKIAEINLTRELAIHWESLEQTA